MKTLAVSLASAILVSLIFIPPVANAASFDCKKAVTSIEHQICSDPMLSKMDTLLAKAYERALLLAEDKDAIRNDQRKWLNRRNQCKDNQCLRLEYAQRFGFITSNTRKAPPPVATRNLERWYLVSGGDWAPSSALLEKIDHGLKAYVNSWNKIERTHLRDWESYKFQYQGRKGSDGKFVYINALCSTNPNWLLNREIVPTGNGRGGACYFNLRYDPDRSLFYALKMDDRWRNDEGTRVNNSECWGAGNTIQNGACFSEEKEETDLELAKAVDKFSNEPSFKVEQSAWIAERKVACDEEASELEGGTGYGNQWAECYTRFNKKRIHELIDRANRRGK